MQLLWLNAFFLSQIHFVTQSRIRKCGLSEMIESLGALMTGLGKEFTSVHPSFPSAT